MTFNCFIALLILAITWPIAGNAVGWQWFQMCKHATGDEVHRFNIQGIETEARAYIDTAQIIRMVPISGDKCSVIEFRDGSHLVVHDTPKGVRCKIQQGPGCDE